MASGETIDEIIWDRATKTIESFLVNNTEAKSILAETRRDFSARDHNELVLSVDHTEVKNVVGESGANYQIEFDVFWDSKPDGNPRILASIDDGGWRAFLPLTDSLIMTPDGTLL